MRRTLGSLISLGVLVTVTACGGAAPTDASSAPDGSQPVPNDPSPPTGAEPASVVLVSGGNQGLGAYERTDPFVVRIEDARGVGVAEATVQWSLVKGFGILLKAAAQDAPIPSPGRSEVTTTSNDRGEASSILETRDVAGTYVVEARVAGVVVPVRISGYVSP